MTKTLLAASLLLLPVGMVSADILKVQSKKLIVANGTAVAVGGVIASYGDYFLRADRIEAFENNGTIVAYGNVTLWNSDKTVYVKAQKAVYYTREQLIKLFNARGRLKDAYFKSYLLEIKGHIYLFKNFCGSKCGDFSAQICSKGFFYNSTSGRGYLKNALLKIENVPVFYTPWFPFLTKRQSGFLAPTFGVDYYGNFFYRQPFYWAIDRSSDLTVTGDYRSDKLYGVELEYRKYFSGDFYVDTLNGFYIDNAPGQYRWVGRNYYRKHRYLLSGEGYSGPIKFKWDYPSDIDYYYDVYFFKTQLHYKSFAESYIQFWNDDPYYTWNFKVEYFYNLESTDRADDLLIAPDFIFYLKQRPLWKNIYFDWETSLTTFYTQNSATIRFQTSPELKYSTDIGSTPVNFSVIPYYSYYYYGGNKPNGYYENVFGLQFTANSLLYDLSLIETENWNLTSIWEGTYQYQPFVYKQTPTFDYFDQRSRKNLFTLRALNSLNYRGNEVAEVILEQSYNFYTGYNFPTDGAFVEKHTLPLKVFYSIKPPGGWVSLSGKVYYDYWLKTVVLHSESANIVPIKTDFTSLNLSFGYVRSIDHLGKLYSSQYNYGIKLQHKMWNVSFKNYYDAIISKNVKTTVSAGYNKQCWSLSLNYNREYDRDRQQYTWSVYLTLTVFGKGANVFLGGGTQ